MSACRPHGLFYVPSSGGNYFFGVAYTLLGLAFLARYIRQSKETRPHSTIFLMLGCLTYSIGSLMRPSMDMCNLDMKLYLAQLSIIGAAPTFFFAFNWIFISSILRAGNTQRSLATGLSVTGLFAAFVCFSLFLSSGPAYLATGPTAHLIPRTIMKAGAAVQMTYYLLYVVAISAIHFVLARGKRITGIHRAFAVLYVSSILMLIRVSYRLRERERLERRLTRNEAWQICLDALPVFLSVLVWLPFYPVNLLANIKTVGRSNDLTTVDSNEKKRSEDMEKHSIGSH